MDSTGRVPAATQFSFVLRTASFTTKSVSERSGFFLPNFVDMLRFCLFGIFSLMRRNASGDAFETCCLSDGITSIRRAPHLSQNSTQLVLLFILFVSVL